MTEDGFRDLALGLDGVVEASHMGHPDFRANGRIFATLHGNGTTGMVKVTPDQQAELMRQHPEAFAPSNGAWGRQGCTTVTLAAARIPVVRGAMLLAYQSVMAALPRKARPRAVKSRPVSASRIRRRTP